MQSQELEKIIDAAFEDRANITAATQGEVRDAVDLTLDLLDKGKLRVAEKIAGATGPSSWAVNQWLKKAVLLSFRLNDMGLIPGAPGGASWWDKVPSKFLGWDAEAHAAAGFRSVPNAIVRRSAYIAPGVILMPSFVNLGAHVDVPNVSLITCGGQATIPMVYAVSRVVPVEYAEIVASVASPSAGPGTRANIDEFTKTTARGVETIGGAQRGKAIIILNPAEPPMLMQDTIFCAIPADADRDAIAASVSQIAADVAAYVPGYRLRTEPQFDDPTPMSGGLARVAVFVEVEGAGDFLPPYSGNLDIMTAAATRVGEGFATRILAERA